MNRYTFKINNPSDVEIYIDIAADSIGEAVEIANERLDEAERDAADNFPGEARICLSSAINNANIIVNTKFKVDENMIACQSKIDDEEHLRAFQFLTKRDYLYEGRIDELISDEEPAFYKAIDYLDSTDLTAFFKVSMLYDFEIRGYGFHIEAVVMPIYSSCYKNDGSLGYSIRIWDRQSQITFGELPEVLALYEKKFGEFLYRIKNVETADDQ